MASGKKNENILLVSVHLLEISQCTFVALYLFVKRLVGTLDLSKMYNLGRNINSNVYKYHFYISAKDSLRKIIFTSFKSSLTA